MALPAIPDFNPNQPIPNPPFFAPETSYFVGPYYNANINLNSGLTINPDGSISVTGGGGGGGSVSSVSGTAPILVANPTTTPVISVAAASTAAPGVVQLSDSVSSGSSTTAATSAAVLAAYTLAQSASTAATNSLQTTGGTMTGPIVFAAGQTFPLSGLPNATTTQVGVVQLNDTLSSTSTTEALTANQGRLLQQQISSLSVASNITLAGTFDANQSKMLTVTTEGGALPPGSEFVLGADLPAPDANNNNYFVIATVPGTYNPPGGGGPYNVVDGDWLLSDGVVYEYLAVGFTAPYASTTSAGVVELATNAETQAGTDGTLAVTPASLQSKISDSTAVTSSTTIASSTAVKSAYDIAVAAQTAGNNAVPKSLYALKGDILGGTVVAGTPQALALGTPGQVLTVSGASPTGLAWTTPAATGVTSVATGTGLTGGPITTTGTICLANTAVTPGTYNYATLVVDAQGRLTCAVSGAAPNTIACLPLTNAGTAGAPILCINSATISDCGAVRLATTGEAFAGTSQTIALTPLGAASTYIACSQLAAKGSLLTRSSTSVVALPTGGAANNGKVLTINDACAEGLEWKATAVSGGTVTSVGATAGGGLCTSIALGAPITTSGTLGLTNTGVAAGSYTYGAFTVDAQGRLTAAVSCAAPNTTVTAPITNSGTAVAPVIGISDATTAAKGAVQVGTNIDVAAGVISVKSATTAQAGVVQLNDTTSNTSTTLALTAAQGKNLQDQINNLSVTSNLTLAGTINGSDGKMLTVTTEAAALSIPFVMGADMPPAAAENAEFFAIVTTPGTMTPPGGVAQAVNDGDWWVSDGTSYVYYAVGFSAPYASETASGVVELATDAETQAGTDSTRVIVPSALQSKMSDSTSTTSSTTIASSTAVKAAFDQANTKIACSTLTTTGDMLYASAANTPARLGIGTNGQVLTVSGGVPTWGSAAGTPAATCSTLGTVLGCTFGSNTTLGCLAGSGSASGNTVAIGFQAGCAIAGAFSNTLIGWNAATSLTCGNNTAIGVCALKSATTGTFNIAIGENSGGTLTTGCCNILLGNFASLNTTGTANLILGNNASANGNCNIAIGTNIQLGAGSCQLAIGYDSNQCWLTGDSCKNLRPGAGILSTGGTLGTNGQVLAACANGCGVCWSPAPVPCSVLTTTGDIIYASAANTPARLGVGSTYQILQVIGGLPVWQDAYATPSVAGLVEGCTNGSQVYLGRGAGLAGSAGAFCYNTFVGWDSGRCVSTGCKNTAIGSFSLSTVVNQSDNTALGADALKSLSGVPAIVCGNTGVGSGALCSATIAGCNVGIGWNAGSNLTVGVGNVAIGPNVQFPAANSNCRLVIGMSATQNWLTGDSTGAIRPAAGIADCTGSTGTSGQILTSNGSNGLVWGAAGGASASPGLEGTLYGWSQILSAGTANGNTALGFASGNALYTCRACLTCGCTNLFIGVRAGQNVCGTASNNIFIGNRAGYDGALATPTGNTNTAIGCGALCNLTTASSNIAIGNSAGCGVTTGGNNLFLGNFTGRNITFGTENVAIGAGVDLPTTGNRQLAIGWNLNGYWLTGNCFGAIKPGAGIIDCAGSCGTNGQVLMSNGANAVCWGTAAGGSGTVTSITVGTGLASSGSPITTTGTICMPNVGPGAVTCGNVSGLVLDAQGRVTAIGTYASAPVLKCEYTAKGVLLTASAAGTTTALTVGANNTILVADSACTGGLKWIANPSIQCALLTTTGDTIYASSAGVPARLGIGTSGQVLTVSAGGIPVWCTAGGGSAATQTTAGTLLGYTNGASVTVANNAVVLGHCAGGITTGNCNTFVGGCAGQSVTVLGCTNTAVGIEAGRCLGQTSGNTFVGTRAGCTVQTLGCNIAIGCDAMNSVGGAGVIISGGCNIAIGNRALTLCSTIGANSYDVKCNIAIGHGAMGSLNAGPGVSPTGNVAIGTNAGACLSTSQACAGVYIGDCAGCNAGVVGNAIAIGCGALANSGTGNDLIAIGRRAGCNAGGCWNVLIGCCAGAGASPIAGCNNILIGATAGTNVGAAMNNMFVLGYGNSCTTSCLNGGVTFRGYAFFGVCPATWLELGTTTWNSTSDARLKEDVKDVALGLDFISEVKPRSFKWIGSEKTAIGFVAQELLEVVEKYNAEDLALVDHSEANEYMGVAPTALIPVMVNAIKELKAENTALREELNSITDRLGAAGL